MKSQVGGGLDPGYDEVWVGGLRQQESGGCWSGCLSEAGRAQGSLTLIYSLMPGQSQSSDPNSPKGEHVCGDALLDADLT